MLEIFHYLKTNDINSNLNYGIKLSENYDKKLELNEVEKLFLVGLLNPKDDIEKFNNRQDFLCVRLKLNDINLKIADNSLYGTPYYEKTIINMSDYQVGTYMNPEVLISTSILPEDIEQIDYDIDYPILYNSSEELYVNNLIEALSLKLDNCKNIMLKALLDEYGKHNNLNKHNINGLNVYTTQDENFIFRCK